MKRVGLYLALFLIIMMIIMPLYALTESLSLGKIPTIIDRLHWSTNNTTRVWADDWQELQNEAVSILKEKGGPINLVIVTDDSSWQNPLLFTCLLAKPSNAILYMMTEDNKEEILSLVKNIRPIGLPALQGTEVILNGKSISLGRQLRDSGLEVLEINGDVHEVSEKIIELREEIDPNLSEFILVDMNDDFRYALPAGSWAVHQGTPIIPVDDNTLSPQIGKKLQEFNNPFLYLISNKNDVNTTLLSAIGKVRKIKAGNPWEAAVNFARYYDAETQFGWRANQATAEGGKMFLAAPDDDWHYAAAGIQLFSREIFGPLLFISSGQVPAMVEKFYFDVKPDWWVTPAEGPYNHTWILGSKKIISYAVQGRINFIQEISNYETQGDQGMSGIEALALVWYFLAIAGALWVWAHLSTHLFMLSPFMKLAWILLVLATGLFGIWAYYMCYRGYAHRVAYGEFRRPLWIQSLAATCSTAGYGIPIMITIAFIMTYFGLPLFLNREFLFVLGTPMFQSVLWSYLGTILVNALLFVPLMLSLKENSSYGDTVKSNWLTVIISMTFISIGMMTAMWLLMMGLDMRPEESNLNWWAVMYTANLVGIATGYVGNWLLVSYGEKKGNM